MQDLPVHVFRQDVADNRPLKSSSPSGVNSQCCDCYILRAGCQMCGVCTISGWEGGLALLSNLERSPLSKVLLRGLPAQGGFEAAYYGTHLTHLQDPPDSLQLIKECINRLWQEAMLANT